MLKVLCPNVWVEAALGHACVGFTHLDILGGQQMASNLI